ncbi:hypothetical protein [Lactiplantibacillus daowaiensis]|uniref:Uncharacterized protein n=1 Tax=Lactiplantibacillus daowaiensis TaxID=2559918 RepID=A0ABW1RXM2_9LACO|nr:hypothetical protein [Lactiplantibacillus daowaiensis]
MRPKSTAIILFSLLLGIGALSGPIATTATAASLPASSSRYWYHFHKVRIRKGTWAHQVKVMTPAYKDHYVAKVYLKPGTTIYAINGGASWHWVVKGHGLTTNSHYFWVTTRTNSQWLKK